MNILFFLYPDCRISLVDYLLLVAFARVDLLFFLLLSASSGFPIDVHKGFECLV